MEGRDDATPTTSRPEPSLPPPATRGRRHGMAFPSANFNHLRADTRENVAEKSTMDFAATDAPLYFVNVSIDHRTPMGSSRRTLFPCLPFLLPSFVLASRYSSSLSFSLFRRVVAENGGGSVASKFYAGRPLYRRRGRDWRNRDLRSSRESKNLRKMLPFFNLNQLDDASIFNYAWSCSYVLAATSL